MKRYTAYLRYVLAHKWYVFLACRWMKVPFLRAVFHDWSKFSRKEFTAYAVNFYNPDGSRRDRKSLSPVEQSNFLTAWHNHESRNPHHWGYWLVSDGQKNRFRMTGGDGGYPLGVWDDSAQKHIAFEHVDALVIYGEDRSTYRFIVRLIEELNDQSSLVAAEMPETYVREMIADWIGAGWAITGKIDVREWYSKNKGQIILHPSTRQFVEQLLAEFTPPKHG